MPTYVRCILYVHRTRIPNQERKHERVPGHLTNVAQSPAATRVDDRDRDPHQDPATGPPAVRIAFVSADPNCVHSPRVQPPWDRPAQLPRTGLWRRIQRPDGAPSVPGVRCPADAYRVESRVLVAPSRPRML